MSRIIKLIFGDNKQPTEEELAKQKRAHEKNRSSLNLMFPGLGEEREANLDDIQVYLTEDIKPSKFGIFFTFLSISINFLYDRR